MTKSTQRWGTLSDNWGDVLCCLGFYRARVGEGGVIYTGIYPEIVEFLKAQPFISEVKFNPIDDDTKWKHYNNEIARTAERFDYMAYVSKAVDIDATAIERTHLCHEIVNCEKLEWWHNASLPEGARTWADEMAASIGRPFYIVQPFSFASNNYNSHWPYWIELLQVLPQTDATFVLVGHRWGDAYRRHQQEVGTWMANNPDIPIGQIIAFANSGCHVPNLMEVMPPPGPNWINLVDGCPSNTHLFALAERATGIITTSNSLAHWANVQNIPHTIICNMTSSNMNYFFRRILEHPQAEILHAEASVDDAVAAISRQGMKF